MSCYVDRFLLSGLPIHLSFPSTTYVVLGSDTPCIVPGLPLAVLIFKRHRNTDNDQSTSANPDSAPSLTASLLEQVPEDHEHSIKCFLIHPQIATERPPLGFRKIESEEEAKARVKAQVDAVVAVLGPSSNPPPNQ
ncbi:hypothetical protein J3E69DRAFT_336853 [Trichoderma sp. SZMC 28015]